MNVVIKLFFGGTLSVIGLGGLMILLGDTAGNKVLASDGWSFAILGVLLFLLELLVIAVSEFYGNQQ